jgi:nitroreductase
MGRMRQALRSAPSACNYQPWRFIFVAGAGLRAQVMEASFGNKAWMAASPEMAGVPVAVLSTSASEKDIGKDFPRIRGTFAAKPHDFRQLVKIIKKFRDFAATQ